MYSNYTVAETVNDFRAYLTIELAPSMQLDYLNDWIFQTFSFHN